MKPKHQFWVDLRVITKSCTSLPKSPELKIHQVELRVKPKTPVSFQWILLSVAFLRRLKMYTPILFLCALAQKLSEILWTSNMLVDRYRWYTCHLVLFATSGWHSLATGDCPSQAFICYGRTKFIAWCLRQPSWELPTGPRNFATAANLSFCLCPTLTLKKAMCRTILIGKQAIGTFLSAWHSLIPTYNCKAPKLTDAVYVIAIGTGNSRNDRLS